MSVRGMSGYLILDWGTEALVLDDYKLLKKKKYLEKQKKTTISNGKLCNAHINNNLFYTEKFSLGGRRFFA